MEPVGRLARRGRQPRPLPQDEGPLFRRRQPLVGSQQERLAARGEEVANGGEPRVAARQEVLGGVGGATQDRRHATDVVTQQSVLQSEKQGKRVLEAATRDTALLGAGHQVEHAGPRDGDRRRGGIRERDRGAPGVAMTPERRGRLRGLAARRDPDRDGAGATRRRRDGARVLGDGMDPSRAEPGGDHRGRVSRRTHPQQDDPPGSRWDGAPDRRRIQPVRQRTEPLGLVFQIA